MGQNSLVIQIQTILQDLRYGARILFRNVSFTIVAVLALALGIGVNTVCFTAYKAFFARSLDARDPSEMVNLAVVLRSGHLVPDFSYPDYEIYRDNLHSFSGVVAESSGRQLTLTDAGDTVSQRSSADNSLAGKMGLLSSSNSNKEYANARIVSENYFSVLGIPPLRGRGFGDSSSLAGSPAVLISENYWQRRFLGSPSVLGRNIRLNGMGFTIVGITPHDFAGTSMVVPDFWVPLSLQPLLQAESSNVLHNREDLCCRLYARLAHGSSINKAQEEMTLLAGQLSALHDSQSELSRFSSALIWPGSPLPLPLNLILGGGLKHAILLIMVAVGMVLVIACANVGSLQLARSTARQNELSMRVSLGANRLRLIRQLLTESALLGVLSGVIALFFSWILMKLLATMAAHAFPAEYGTLIFQVTPDLGIFAYSFVMSLAAGVMFGLTPALESSASALSSALKANASTSPLRRRRILDLFIASQVAVALALLIAASMLIRSSIHLLERDPGYQRKNIVELDLHFPEESQYTVERRAALVQEIRRRLEASPGVASITSANSPIFVFRRARVSLNGEKPSGQNTSWLLPFTFIEPNYFPTLGISLLSGHSFQLQPSSFDSSIILSESAAKRIWPGQNPVGQSLRLFESRDFQRKNRALPNERVYRVIGVAHDTRGATFDGSDAELGYLPMPEEQIQDYSILVRTRTEPKQFIHSIYPLISSIDPDLEVSPATLQEIFRQTPAFSIPTFAAAVASPVGLIGLLLASMGIYGTISYVVVLRTREIGIRMALGAPKRKVLGLMLQQCIRPVSGGLLVGILLAAGISFLLRGVLTGVRIIDGISFAGVSILFAAIALIAAFLPSRRAMDVEPVVALRYE